MLRITKEIALPVKRVGDKIVITSLPVLQIVMGTTAITGSMHMYKIEKTKQGYEVPISSLEQRIAEVSKQLDSLYSKLDMMRQIYEEVKKNGSNKI